MKDEGQVLTSSEPAENLKVHELNTNEPEKIIDDPVTVEDGSIESKTKETPTAAKSKKRGKKTAASYAIEFFIKQ